MTWWQMLLLLLAVPYAILLVVTGWLTRHALAEAGLVRWGAGLLLKSLAWLLTLLVLGVGALSTYQELTKRPRGSPPPGYEGRLKYPRGHISSFPGFDNIPVDLWFGKKRDGRVDTTHLRIASDYFGKLPFWHGEYAELNVVWPSLRSIDEEVEIRKKRGQPHKRLQTFKMTLKETDETSKGAQFTDQGSTGPATRCEPMIRDEARGVRYCNENRLNNKPGERWTNYWPLDESIRTPFYGNPPHFTCSVIERLSDGGRFDRCYGYFSYNTDVHILVYTQEELAIAILTDFPKLIDFLHTLEVTP